MIHVPFAVAGVLLAAPPAGDRTFTLTYAVEVAGLPPGKPVRLWVPVPKTTPEQTVELACPAPAGGRFTEEPEYGNRILYLEPTPDAAGTVALTLTYRVTRRTVGPAADGSAADRFLKPDKLVPVGGKPLRLIAGKPLPADEVAKARALFDVVFENLRYGKDVAGWGRGDAEWVCDTRTGNCSDFHSLFISLARSQGLPAKFEIGFGLPVEKGKGEIAGYHCWAKVRAGGKWVPADVSEPSKLRLDRGLYFGTLPPNRVQFSTGRDVTLEPRQAGGPLNFFIYPYVEAGGQPHPADQVTTKVTFADE